MAGPAVGKAVGKRTRRSAVGQQEDDQGYGQECGQQHEHEDAEPARASKRLRDKRVGPSTTIRNGLATPEPSSLAESLPPADMFPFMQLPAELRIHIYHMALHRSEPLFLHAARAEKDDDQDDDQDADQDADTSASHASHPANASCPLVATSAITTPTRRPRAPSPPSDTPPPLDPVVPAVLRLNQQIYKEARSVLYSHNTFTLSLASGIHTLSTLHQRSRSLIKHVTLTIPSHHDILDGFADLVRLGLRYCWGLKTFKITLQASLPDDGRMTHATSVYANAFHILRWLPRGCKVLLEGNVSEVVRDVVREEGRLQMALDEVGYAKRQHQMPERH